jgi:tetratricopeptide (TPR) repeat protein
MRRFYVIAIYNLMLAAAFSLAAESQTASSLHGVVRDTNGLPVAGVTVSLKEEGKTPSSTRTDSAGVYRFSPLQEGSYFLTATATPAGAGTATLGPFILKAGESKTLDLRLDPSKANESLSRSSTQFDFSDDIRFSVAGVADTTNLGGHGSSVAVVTNKEAVAEEAASVGKMPTGDMSADSLNTARSNVQSLLTIPNQSPKRSAELHHLLGDIEEKSGNPLQAVREYEQAATLNPTEPNLFSWGAELLIHHAPAPAIEVFNKGNRLFPRSVRMLAGLGAGWYALGSYDQAVRRLCEASDLDPGDPNPYLLIGKMQEVETEESPCVAEALSRFAKLEPGNALADYYYAASLWKRRKPSENTRDLPQVKSLLEKAVGLDPALGPAYLQLGIIYSEQKDLAKAISAYRHAIKATPSLEQAHYRLARAYRQSGDLAKAHAELQLYEQISGQKERNIERQHHEVQQFVYQLRDQAHSAEQQ